MGTCPTRILTARCKSARCMTQTAVRPSHILPDSHDNKIHLGPTMTPPSLISLPPQTSRTDQSTSTPSALNVSRIESPIF